MSAENKTDVEQFLDISTEVCPMSFVLTKRAIDALEDGELLEVLCLAGEPVRSISIQLKDEGHLIKKVEKEGDGHFRIWVEKNGL